MCTLCTVSAAEGTPFFWWLIVATCNTGNDCYQEFEVGDNTNEDEGLRMRSKIKREGLRMMMMGIGKRGKYQQEESMLKFSFHVMLRIHKFYIPLNAHFVL